MQISHENAKTTLRKVAEQLMSLANQDDQGGFRTFRAFVLITRNTCTQQPLAQGNDLRIQIIGFPPLSKKQ